MYDTLLLPWWIMPATPPTIEAIAWLDEPHTALVADLLRRMSGVGLLAVGGPTRGAVSAMGRDFDVPVRDDFRQLRVEHPADFLLLSTVEGTTPDDLGHWLASGGDVLTLEPVASRIDAVPDPAAISEGPTAGRLIQMPLLRCCPGWLRAADPQLALGELRTGSIHAMGPAGAISLFAHLADAMDLALVLFGTPDQIDAQLVGPLSAPPDDLHGLAGSITAHLRYGHHAGLTLHVSDRALRWARGGTLLGADGMMAFDDQHYTLTTRAAEPVATGGHPTARGGADDPNATDQAVPPGPATETVSDETAGAADPTETPILSDLLAAQWQWLLAQRHGLPPIDRRVVIGCCQTVLLSTRTGQSESPQMLLNITQHRAL